MENYNFRFRKKISLAVAVFFLFSSLASPYSFAAKERSNDLSPNVLAAVTNAVPRSAGYVTNYDITPGDKVLVYVQDMHCNPGVQKNISKIIASLDENIGVDKIILEGVPEGKADSGLISAIPDTFKAKVVENLLEKGFLTGVELYCVESARDNVYGVEKWETYLENLYRAADLISRQEDALSSIKDFKKQVQKKTKSKIGGISNLISGARDSKWYSDLLLASKEYKLPVYNYQFLGKYIDLRHTSEHLNTKAVTKEFDEYVSELKNTLGYGDFQKLTGKVSDQSAYFAQMYDIVVKGDLAAFAAKYPNLYSFLAYSDKIKETMSLLVYKDEEAYINAILDEASQQLETAQMILLLKMTLLLDSFIKTSMTEEEFAYFVLNLDAYKELIAQYFPKISAPVLSIINDNEYFLYYTTNILRNVFFSDNIQKYSAEQKNDKVNVFVSGGFHSSVVNILAKNKMSYIIISPVVSSEQLPDVYNQLMSINSATNSKLSSGLMSNALSPIPLMLASNSLIPIKNREAYFDILIKSIGQSAAFTSETDASGTVHAHIEPQALKEILENWLHNAHNIAQDKISITIDEKGLNVAADYITLSYPVKDGLISFSDSQVDGTADAKMFSIAYYTALSTIKNLFVDFYDKVYSRALYEMLPVQTSKYMRVQDRYFDVKERRKDNSEATIADIIFSSLLDLLLSKKDRNEYQIQYQIDNLLEAGHAKKITIDIYGRKISFVFEASIPVSFTREDLYEMVKTAKGSKSINAIPATIIVAKYERSPRLFIDYMSEGVIGVNRALFDIGDADIMKAMLKVGIVHELKHEFAGDMAPKALNTFEEKLNLEDINMLLEEIMKISDMDTDGAETIEQRQDRIKQYVIEKLSMVLETAGKSSDNKFLRKIKNYVIGIEAITELVNRKDMKRADIMHIIATYLDTEKFLIFREEADYKIAKYEKELAKLEAYNRELSNNFLLIKNAETVKMYEREMKKLMGLKAKYENELISARAALQNIEEASSMYREEIIANQKYFFSNIRPSAEEKANKPEYGKYMASVHGDDNKYNKSGVIDQERKDIVDYHFNAMLENFEKMLERQNFSESEIKTLSDKFRKSFDSSLKVLYYNLPEHLFRRYFSDTTVVHNHALLHSIEVLAQAVRIIEYDSEMLKGLKDGTFDIPAVVFGAIMHDISNIIARPSHELNSTYMIDSIFAGAAEGIDGYGLDPEKGFNHKVYIDPQTGRLVPESAKTQDSIELDVQKLKNICFGHKKIKPNKPLDVHKRHLEAQLLHDADGFSAIFDLQRIMDLKFEQNEVIFNENLTLKERVELILQNDYLRGDALNDHIRQGFFRKSAPFYTSAGAKRLVESARNTALEELKRNIMDNAEKIKMSTRIKTDTLTTYYSDADIEKMLSLIQKTVDALKKVEKDPDAINDLDDTTRKEKIDPMPVFLDKDMTNIMRNAASWGAVRLPKFVVLSDIHGADERFEFLLKDMLNINQEEALTPEMLKQALDDSDIDKLYLLGDNIDRGPGPVRVLELVRVLMESDKTELIIGNHDNNAQMNILGVHLPFYDNYRGIDEDYEVTLNLNGAETVINVSSLLRLVHKEEANIIASMQARDAAASDGENTEQPQPSGVKTKAFWAAKFEEYVSYANEQQKKIWDAEKMRAAGIFKEMYGTAELDMESGSDILNYPDAFTAKNKIILEDKELYEWWKAILAHNVQTIVFKGLADVHKMSLNWWIERYDELKNFRQKYPEHEAYWKEMDDMLGKIVSEIKGKIEHEMENKNRAWLVVDSIMYRNFESTEWYAYDWAFHSGWGDMEKGLLSVRKRDLEENAKKKKEAAKVKKDEAAKLQSKAAKMTISDDYSAKDIRNAREATRAAQREASQAEKEAISANNQIISYSNYFEDSFIVELMEFYKDNFNLFTIDPYGGLHMHAILPIDEDGDAAIGYVDKNGKMHTHDRNGKRIKGLYYKGEYYYGPSILEGLYRISVDIKTYDYADSLSEILEALTLLNSIYADNTVAIKPQEISKNAIALGKKQNPDAGDEEALKIGFDIIAQKLGVPVIYAGHNTLSKLEQVGIGEVIYGPDGSIRVVNVDDDMSPKYGGRGSYKVISAALGILRAGFEGPKKGEKKYIQRELVSSALFMGRIINYVKAKLLERQVFRMDNSLFINISSGKNILAERSKLETMTKFGAETYNIEIVNNAGVFHGQISPEKHTLNINGLSAPVNVSVYESVTPTGVHLVQIVPDFDVDMLLHGTSYNKKKDTLLVAILKEFSKKHADKKFFIRTSVSTDIFSKEVNSGWLERTVFLKDKADDDNVQMNITMLSEEVTEAIERAWGAKLVMEQIPLPATDTSRFDEMAESLNYPSESMQSILTAA